MKHIFGLLILVIVVLACNNKNLPEPDPCSILINGVYIYPTEPPDSTLSKKEKKEYWNIPEDILNCITTNGLIQSCYNANCVIFISAANGYQPGYELVKKWNRGLDELESRTNAPQALIEYYDLVNIPHSIDYGLFTLEVLMAQNSILEKLTIDQKIKILNLSLNYYLERRNIFNRGSIIYDGTIIIMGRLLKFDNYQPFNQATERNTEIYNFLTDGYAYILSAANADTIIHYTNQYINHLNIN